MLRTGFRRRTRDAPSCSDCIAAITRSVHCVDPGAKVAADLAAKRVDVETAKPVEVVEGAIADAGYTVADRRA